MLIIDKPYLPRWLSGHVHDNQHLKYTFLQQVIVNLIMRYVTTLSLVENTRQTAFSQACSEVYFDSKPSGIIVSGKILETAFHIDNDRYLIFTTDDVLFEESLTITLLSLNKGVIEVVHPGGEYASGTFENAKTDEDSVHFQFIDDVRWTIKISESARFRIPFLADPKGVKRSSGLKTHMTFLTTLVPEKVK
ncbi:hypothetical protein [Pantoea sp.]|uniref:hypothetical protein n=1 Tax=Pantoea sp. TaxID=69393 RepID=UPI0028ADB05F|nr:hypothetical protein [Pantoea sp.]